MCVATMFTCSGLRAWPLNGAQSCASCTLLQAQACWRGHRAGAPEPCCLHQPHAGAQLGHEQRGREDPENEFRDALLASIRQQALRRARVAEPRGRSAPHAARSQGTRGLTAVWHTAPNAHRSATFRTGNSDAMNSGSMAARVLAQAVLGFTREARPRTASRHAARRMPLVWPLLLRATLRLRAGARCCCCCCWWQCCCCCCCCWIAGERLQRCGARGPHARGGARLPAAPQHAGCRRSMARAALLLL